MLRVGLNPYGIAFTIGLQGRGTPRANPNPLGLAGYLDLADEIGAATIEIPTALLTPLTGAELRALRERLDRRDVTVVLSQGLGSAHIDAATGGVASALSLAPQLGIRLMRMSLTSVLCGDRAAPDCRWTETVAHVRRALGDAARRAADAGVTLAIENHQDFTSAEMADLCESVGPSVGICLDTGNALAVGECPLAFARAVAPHVRHVHLKDYQVQWTDQGYRLIRCAIGDGAIPFPGIAAILAEHTPRLPAAIEPGALSVRHVRLLTPEWWEGYPDRSARALAEGLAAARVRRLPETAEWRTPWEAGADAEAVIDYETAMLRRSVANLKEMGMM